MSTTIYHLPNAILPNGMIPLNSRTGQEMLNAGLAKVRKNEKMLDLFKSQVNKTYCGAASLALVINGTGTAYRIKISYGLDTPDEIKKKQNAGKTITVDENDIINLDKDFFQKINIDRNGMTLEEIAYVSSYAGYGEITFYVISEEVDLPEEKQEELSKILENGNRKTLSSVTEFRDFVKDFFQKSTIAGLICNYDMAALGYVEYKGHFSPLAAYNSEYDTVLVMDVWPKTQPAWVKTELFFNAMTKVDSISGLPRGFIEIHELM